MTTRVGERDRNLRQRVAFNAGVVALAVAGFAVPVVLGPPILRLVHPDPQEWEPSDADVREALDGLGFPVQYSVREVDGGLRWYRGRATRRGVPVRFAFLVGEGAAERSSPPSNFHLLPGRPDIGAGAPTFRLVYQADASLLPGETPGERARRRVAYYTSFSILDAVTEQRDD
ncbi:MAG: hypothetical protein QOE69_2704 [Thermoleophilaceae bacterium]|jgi:hypothetical protein|nr:hypothetical protein [Thermoleophilaceae bacterium]MEA2408585.1 hypothetical protein [Thermoleophilaceae bacterium]